MEQNVSCRRDTRRGTRRADARATAPAAAPGLAIRLLGLPDPRTAVTRPGCRPRRQRVAMRAVRRRPHAFRRKQPRLDAFGARGRQCCCRTGARASGRLRRRPPSTSDGYGCMHAHRRRSHPRSARAQRCCRQGRAATRASDGRVAEAVRKEQSPSRMVARRRCSFLLNAVARFPPTWLGAALLRFVQERRAHPESGLRAVASLIATGSSKPSPRR